MADNGVLIRLARMLMPVLCLAVFGGCSMLRLGYGQLDHYAAWQADEYFDLEPAQKEEFAKRFERLHEWHRYDQLPEYAAFLAAVQGRLQKGLAREDALWVMDGIKQRYRVLVNRTAEDAAAMLMTVTAPQLDQLQRRWERDNRRFVREYRLDDDADEQKHARARRVLSRIRDWVGHLDDDQEKQIIAWADQQPMIHGLRHEDRQRRQREFLQLMAQRGDRREFTVKLRHWLANWEEGRNPRYDRLFREWEQKQADFYVAVYRMLLPHQRTAVGEKVQKYANDFKRLAQRPEAETSASR